jgi:hypothetical protein
MHLMTSKFQDDPSNKHAVLSRRNALNAHKFEINISDVFGSPFITKDISTWLEDKPIEVFDWLKLPFTTTYFELRDWTNMITKKDRMGLYVESDDGLLRITLMAYNGKIGCVAPYTVLLGIDRELNSSDFDSPQAYGAWKEYKWNYSKRFTVHSHSNNIHYGTAKDSELASECLCFAVILLETLLYLNAKGVGTVKNVFRPKNSVLRKSAITDWTYKTLRIIKKGEASEIINKTKRQIPFTQRDGRETHVRGHVAVYTEDRPRFGKLCEKNIGPQWISPHVRNRGTEGKIVKDYEVV